MVQAQASALSAKDAYDAAVVTCVNALEQASDAPTGPIWDGTSGGTFDERYASFGGDPTQLHFIGTGFAAAQGAIDGAAWQKAKLNPADPVNQKMIDDIKQSLTDHLNDQDYLTAFANVVPEDVAAFQGLPAIEANALNMAKLREDIKQPGCPHSLQALYQHLADLNDPLYKDNMFLLGFDAKGSGHAVVSYGNPDTAANTAVYVPGTTSTLASAGGDIGRARALYVQAPNQMASVYWLGYDAPDWPSLVGGSAPDDGPAIQRYADQGGPLLASFVNSLKAQHQGAQNLTLLGHSYGTTVVGDALAHYGAHAQGAIFVGSPGLTVKTASDLHLDPGRVWASKMPFDPVPAISIPLNWTSALLPLTPVGLKLSNVYDDHTIRFGNDPTSSSFGGRTFNSDDGSTIMHAHSNYWDRKGPGLGNMAKIVIGDTNGIQPMSQDAKNGPLSIESRQALLGTILQNSGRAFGDWGAPIEHMGNAVQSYASITNLPAAVAGDLITGDVSGAGHQITDVPGEAWNGVKNVGSAIHDFMVW